jgi:AAA+ superfamily predicted ATPase
MQLADHQRDHEFLLQQASQFLGCPGPGVILLDDYDLERRADSPDNPIGRLLTVLDGLQVREGAVFLLTSNCKPGRLDPALRRPGRIDVILHLSPPDAPLRRRYIEETWDRAIVSAIDVDGVVATTADLSFAELEEIKKLLVLAYLREGRWDFAAAWQTFRTGRFGVQQRRPIGFDARTSLGYPLPADPLNAVNRQD